MSEQHAVQQLAFELQSGKVNRRDLFKRAAALGISATVLGSVMATDALPALAQDLTEVPRENTLIAVRGGTQGKFTEGDLLWNPYLPLANHQLAVQMVYEPLAVYSAFTDSFTYWLAESYEYNDDYSQLTVKTRPGITWSDGTPFTAEDVAWTFNKLVEVGPAVKFGADVQISLKEATAPDDTTVVFDFIEAAPRFFEFISYKFDIGCFITPKHIFENEDFTTFAHYDPAKGYPVTTAPWKVVYSAPEQKVLDRLDSWWGEAAGVGKLPEPLRYIFLPDPGEQNLAAGVISNQYDISTGLQPTTFGTVFDGNDKTTTWSGRDVPYGNIDWWPHSLYLNNTVEPWSDPNVRWAISYYIDRDQIIEFAWNGASLPSTLFLPDYPGLAPFMEAAQPLFEQYPYLEHNPEKGDALLTAKGWTKDGDNWKDENGNAVKLDIQSFFDFTSVGPVIVEQLKQNGIDATYSEPPDFFTTLSGGRLHRRALRARRQLQLGYLLLDAALPERIDRDSGRSPRQLLTLEERGVGQADRPALRHQPDRYGHSHGYLESGHRALAGRLSGHPDLPGHPPPADERDLLDRLADPGRSVHQPGALPPHLPDGHAPALRPPPPRRHRFAVSSPEVA